MKKITVLVIVLSSILTVQACNKEGGNSAEEMFGNKTIKQEISNDFYSETYQMISDLNLSYNDVVVSFESRYGLNPGVDEERLLLHYLIWEVYGNNLEILVAIGNEIRNTDQDYMAGILIDSYEQLDSMTDGEARWQLIRGIFFIGGDVCYDFMYNEMMSPYEHTEDVGGECDSATPEIHEHKIKHEIIRNSYFCYNNTQRQECLDIIEGALQSSHTNEYTKKIAIMRMKELSFSDAYIANFLTTSEQSWLSTIDYIDLGHFPVEIDEETEDLCDESECGEPPSP